MVPLCKLKRSWLEKRNVSRESEKVLMRGVAVLADVKNPVEELVRVR